MKHVNTFTVRIAWVLLMLYGAATAWILFHDWPPMETDEKIRCAAIVAAPCAGWLAMAFWHKDRDQRLAVYWSVKEGVRNGRAVPGEDTGIGAMYRSMRHEIFLDFVYTLVYAAGCLMAMPWGWLAVSLHFAFSAGIGMLREKQPELFGAGGDEDAAETAALVMPALDTAMGALAVTAAWIRL